MFIHNILLHDASFMVYIFQYVDRKYVPQYECDLSQKISRRLSVYVVTVDDVTGVCLQTKTLSCIHPVCVCVCLYIDLQHHNDVQRRIINDEALLFSWGGS